MSKTWIRTKLPEFVRDVFRGFCLASRQLSGQFQRFDEEREVSYEVLRDLLGSEMSKGLLWRLKDTAHHVFRNDPECPVEGRFLDWGLGYIFHETIKLLEDTYQKTNYAPWFREMRDSSDLHQAAKDIAGELFQVLHQTEESMDREIGRIRFIMAKCRQLLPIYLARHRGNMLLARLLVAQNELVREVFAEEYRDLIAGIYGNQPELMYILASQSLRQGGWMEEAEAAVAEALHLNPAERLVLQEKKIIDNWRARYKS
ncbi:MAG TPA: hypothetical protein PKB11_07795 [Desulfovibrio sp.]|uniref:hypothetical protein n=2 Tax=Desulfovibrionaceae TaxID=194924 RepID=UPI002A447DE5|nr:hypothetical protein [Desulfovibrio sp.]MDY0305182.1 hypothetical protein [Desulfovibrionaceae bacterium]HMM38644.1 hypothetical protein [Desulfovibrio sp.]